MDKKEAYFSPIMEITLFKECFIRMSFDNDYNSDDDDWDDENANPIGAF